MCTKSFRAEFLSSTEHQQSFEDLRKVPEAAKLALSIYFELIEIQMPIKSNGKKNNEMGKICLKALFLLLQSHAWMHSSFVLSSKEGDLFSGLGHNEEH